MTEPGTAQADTPRAGRAAAPGPPPWSGFAAATTPEQFFRGWLALTCHRLEQASAALLLLGPADAGPYTLAAGWPDDRADFGALAGVAERCLQDRRPVIEPLAGGAGLAVPATLIAFPLLGAGALHGTVVVRSAARGEAAVQSLLRELHWSTAWIDAWLLRESADRAAGSRERTSRVIELAAIAIDSDDARSACTGLVNELATHFGCDRVSLGFRTGRRTRLSSLSHSASFGRQMNLVRSLEAAMDEALDQASTIRLPTGDDDTRIVQAHRDLQRLHGSTELLTVPVVASGEQVGALTLERAAREPFTADEVELLEGLAGFAGPVLELRRRDDRWIGTKVADAGRRQLARLLGPGFLGRKVALGAALAIAAFLGFATGTHTVTADAAVQGAVQRAVVAPRNGFVARVHVRPGDAVKAGEALFALDDRDLQLERLQVDSRRAQLLSEHREVKAAREWAQANILAAQIRQAAAQRDLLDAELARSERHAPFDAIVVAGDLSQSLGAPVERGQVLLQLAPLDEYRIVLSVDERDIDHVHAGQHGALLLAALADEDFRFRVERVTPVASARDGGNFFRVEARLEGDGHHLRPGMEGVAKVAIGERRLLWIWTHRLAQLVKVWSWQWLP